MCLSLCVYYAQVGANRYDMQWRLRKWYGIAAALPECAGSAVVPAGDLWERNYNDTRAINIHQSDYSHPTVAGTYLTALTFVKTICQLNTLGSLAHTSGLSSSEASYYRELVNAFAVTPAATTGGNIDCNINPSSPAPTPAPAPTSVPTAVPTPAPTVTPVPTLGPTNFPTTTPSSAPTLTPGPTLGPTLTPAPIPTAAVATPIPTTRYIPLFSWCILFVCIVEWDCVAACAACVDCAGPRLWRRHKLSSKFTRR
jgi:hypothetical protein